MLRKSAIRMVSVRAIGALLLAAVAFVMATSLGPSSSGQEQGPTNSVKIYQGITHVAYLGPTLAVEEALANATPHIKAIWSFDRFDAASPWKLWSAGLPDGLQGFTALTFGEAYFTVSTLTFDWNYADGVVPAIGTGVELVMGGNSVVYLGPTQTVADALVAVAPGTTPGQLTVDVIWRYDPERDPDRPWSLWSRALPIALRGFDRLSFGEPYFIVAETPGTLSFIGNAAQGTQELAILENYAATTFFPAQFVVLEGIPVRVYFSRLHREHVNQFAISPFLTRSDPILPGEVAILDFLPDTAGAYRIRNIGHQFEATLWVVESESEAVARRSESGMQTFALIHRLADRRIFPQRSVVQVGIPVRIYNLGVDANFRVSIEPFYTPANDNVAIQEVSSFTFTPDQTGTFVIRDELNGLEATLIVQ